MANCHNGMLDILVIGGRKRVGSNRVRDFWNDVAGKLGRSIDFRHSTIFGTGAIASVNFKDYALIVVATDRSHIKGHLTANELKALTARSADIFAFLCGGGTLFASSCNLPDPYGYVSKMGSVASTAGTFYSSTPTAAGIAIGFGTTAMPHGPWHNHFTAFPSYLMPLSLAVRGTEITAIGGIGLDQISLQLELASDHYCLSDPMIATGSASVGVGRHFWSVQECDAKGTGIGVEAQKWTDGPATSIAIAAFAADHGLTMQCNRRYRIKLAAAGICVDWVETVQVIEIRCPAVNAGPDKCVKCDGGFASLGLNQPVPGVSYSWSPAVGLTSTTDPNPTHTGYTGSYPITYTVVATAADGCKNSDTVTLYCKPPTLTLKAIYGCCSIRIVATATNYSTISWSSGETAVEEIVTNTEGEYSCSVTNACGTVTKKIGITAAAALSGPFNPISANTMFAPNSGALPNFDHLFIMDEITGNGQIGTPNAYNASQVKIVIYDRGGTTPIHEIESPVSCTGFDNWAIKWDGTDDSGNLFPLGTYNYLVYMKNCTTPEYSKALTRQSVKQPCIEWVTLFGIKLWCKKRDTSAPQFANLPMEPGVVTISA